MLKVYIYLFILFKFKQNLPLFQTPAACQKFEIRSVAISVGRIRGEIVLTEAVDYEEQTSYTMSVVAEVRKLHFF